MKTSADTNALRPGTALHGRRTYVIEGLLGVGGFGITYLSTGNVRAVAAIVPGS